MFSLVAFRAGEKKSIVTQYLEGGGGDTINNIIKRLATKPEWLLYISKQGDEIA